jgi:hypothetical protein
MKKEKNQNNWPCKYCSKILDDHTQYRNCITEGILPGSYEFTPIDNLKYLEKCIQDKVDKNQNSRKV